MTDHSKSVSLRRTGTMFSVRVPNEIATEIKAKAVEQGVSVSDLIRSRISNEPKIVRVCEPQIIAHFSQYCGANVNPINADNPKVKRRWRRD